MQRMPRGFGFGGLLIVTLAIGYASADEGMWVYNQLPTKILKERYGFEPPAGWAEHLMRSSVRFNSGGSGSFVSSTGLVLTNHHVAADTLAKISTAEHNYYRDGFLAKSHADEVPARFGTQPACRNRGRDRPHQPSGRGGSVGQGAANAAGGDRSHREGIDRTDQAPQRRHHAVSRWGLSPLSLQEIHRCAIMLAPEFSIAFFGGDADNFEYPRHDLDMGALPRLRERSAGED